MFSLIPSRRARRSALVSASSLLGLTAFADAFSFNIDNTPTQCQNLSISITGSGGTPPYHALIVPFGQTPLSNNVEARTIVDQEFDGDSTSVSFQLKYPALSQFVVVVRHLAFPMIAFLERAQRHLPYLFRSVTMPTSEAAEQAQQQQWSTLRTRAVSHLPNQYNPTLYSTPIP